MPLATLEKEKVRKWLMMSLPWGDSHQHLTAALNKVDGNPDAVTLIQDVLTKLDGVETAITDQRDVMIAQQAGDIKLSSIDGLKGLYEMGWRYVIQLGGMLGVQPRFNPFGDQAPTYIFADPSGFIPGGISPDLFLPRG